MREIRHVLIDIDRQLEEAARAKQQLDAERWRTELRPRAMRSFAASTAKLTWSRALLKLVVDELYPDDLFTELIGNLDRVPRRQWPHVVAIAVALRHSWRRDGLVRIAKRLHLSLRFGTPGYFLLVRLEYAAARATKDGEVGFWSGHAIAPSGFYHAWCRARIAAGCPGSIPHRASAEPPSGTWSARGSQNGWR